METTGSYDSLKAQTPKGVTYLALKALATLIDDKTWGQKSLEAVHKLMCYT